MSDLDHLLSQASSLSMASPERPPRAPSPPSSAAPSHPAARIGGLGDDIGQQGFGRGGGGRFGRHVVSLKSYSVISIRSSDSLLCFGSVGVGNAAFCIRPNCRIKAHVDAKVKICDELEESRIFIIRSPGSTAFLEPSVSANKVSPEVLASWETQQFTLSEWNREFCAVEIANDVTASMAEIKEEASFLMRAKDFRTPSKRSRESTSISSELHKLMGDGPDRQFITHTRLMPVVESLEDEETDLQDGVLVGEGDNNKLLTKAVTEIETSVVSLGEAMVMLSEQSHNRFVSVDHEAKLVAGAVHTMNSHLGMPIELDERFEAPTLWGTTAFIADEVSKLNQDVLTLELGLKPLQTEMEWAKAALHNVQGQEDSAAKMRQILGLVMERVRAMGPELENARRRLDEVEQKQETLAQEQRHSKRAKFEDHDLHGSNQKHPSGGFDPSMDDLLHMLNGNSIGTPPTGSGSSSQGHRQRQGGGSSGFESGSTQHMRFDDHARMVITQLVVDVGLLKAAATDKALKFGGLGLRSIQDCQVWIEENFSCYRYGLIMDPLLMLDRVFGNDGLESKTNQLKIWESRIKLKISTGAEQSALQAINFKRPQLFHSGKTAMVSERNKSKLNQIPTFAAWKSGGEGVRNYIVNQMNIIYASMTEEIAYALGCDSRFMKANALALRSLNDTVTFLTQLMNYIDVVYERLHAVSKFTAEQSWSLTTQVLDRICEELYSPKEGIGGVMSVDDPSSVCCHMLWACFKTHDIMATYIEKKFENHPVVSAEYVKFLATNSGSEKVEKLETQVVGLTDKLTKSMEESKKAVAKSDVAATKCAELGRELTALVKRMKTMEDRK
jgi:hypothetical protein